MKSRNVIISLLVVLALLVLVFVRVRYWEPKKKLTFNRNPSRIEYTTFALCRMECFTINANTVTHILKTARATKGERKGNCTSFKLDIFTKQNMHIFIIVDQCGTVAKVVDCYNANTPMPCKCTESDTRPLSYLNSNN